EGTLVHDGGCVWIDSGTERWLMLWPRGSSARQEGAALVVHNGGHRAVVGTRVSAVGGEYKESHYDFVVELVGREISQACRATGQYWLGRDVQTIDPARQGRAD
ncbi:MAG TPA: hypothetical protein VK992_00005, partial [Candidatus Caenarcaniphilales bacterium]|nr:hypothetical protein [Candidatus Caenarcaniphilales bacterium]